MPQFLMTIAVLLTGILPFLASSANAQNKEFIIAKDKVPQVVIGIAEKDVETSQLAAKELAAQLERVVGAKFQIVPAEQISAEQSAILVGDAANRVLDELKANRSDLGSDGIIIRTHGNRLLLTGGEPRGVLYAVYTFLEKNVGIEWFTSEASLSPDQPSLGIPPLDVTYRPKFFYRDPYYFDLVQNPGFAVKLKRNGAAVGLKQIPKELGGYVDIIGFCHTFYRLIPPKTYFEEHPEWFSMINGERTDQSAQLCLSNPGLREEMARRAIEALKAQPASKIISISQNDNVRYCTCPSCQEMAQRLGGQSGLLVDFINEVAAIVATEVPDAMVDTLAYQYTQPAPVGIAPASNVIIRLCSVEADNSEELEASKNSAFHKDLEAWGAISQNIIIWDYTVDFLDGLRLRPSLLQTTKNIPFFERAGVNGVFEQGFDGGQRQISNFIGLKAWVVAHLLWNPSENADALIDRFLKGYYGDAAPSLKAYLELLDGSIRKSGRLPGYGDPDLSGIDGKVLVQADSYFQAALKAVNGNETLTTRVKIEQLALKYAKILRYLSERQSGTGEHLFKSPEDAATACDSLLADATALGVDPGWTNNGYFRNTLVALLETRKAQCLTPEGTIPVECQKLPRDQWIDVQETAMKLYGPKDKSASLVDDKAASNGRAVRLVDGTGAWIVQAQPPSNDAAKTYGIYLVARTGDQSGPDEIFKTGVYNFKTKENKLGPVEKAIDASGEEYKTYFLGDFVLDLDSLIWVARSGSSDPAAALYVDRLFMVDRD